MKENFSIRGTIEHYLVQDIITKSDKFYIAVDSKHVLVLHGLFDPIMIIYCRDRSVFLICTDSGTHSFHIDHKDYGKLLTLVQQYEIKKPVK